MGSQVMAVGLEGFLEEVMFEGRCCQANKGGMVKKNMNNRT